MPAAWAYEILVAYSSPGDATHLLDRPLDIGMDNKIRFRDFDILLKVQQRKLEFRKLFLRHGNTHFAVARVSPCAAGANKCVKPRLDTVRDHGMETLVGRLIATEEVEEVKLGRKGCRSVDNRTPFDEDEGGNMGGVVRELRG